MRNIVLVGFMGTGKTEVAKLLAGRLGMTYVSTDEIIEKKEKRPINEIFNKKGENYFRKIEKEAIKEASGAQNSVIDAGGGAVMDPENVKDLKANGIMVCLWADPEVILERTKRFSHRPLLNVENPLDKIKDLLDKRKPYYERADEHVNTSGLSPDEVALFIEDIAKKQ